MSLFQQRVNKSKNTPILTKSQVIGVVQKIEKGRLSPSFKTNRKHVRYVENIVAEKENGIIPSCPKCGSATVLREAKKGQNVGKKFWGCTKFPQCRGVMSFTYHVKERCPVGWGALTRPFLWVLGGRGRSK